MSKRYWKACVLCFGALCSALSVETGRFGLDWKLLLMRIILMVISIGLFYVALGIKENQ